MSKHIVISRGELADIINDAYCEGWQNGCVDWDGDSHLVQMRLSDFAKSGSAKRLESISSSWRPISEAPLDGTWVLVCSKSYGGLATACKWVPSYWMTAWGACRFANGITEPTHFCPLVKPE